MTYLLAFVSLMIIAGVAIWARRPAPRETENTETPEKPDFTLDRAVLVIGPEMNDPACCEQRTELKRILMPLLEGGYRIVEVYGENPPTQNGEIYDWLDNQLLRDTLNARTGFNLIFVDDKGHMLFHSTRPVIAEALLHIFNLWEHIDGEAGEALAGEPAEEPVVPAQPDEEETPAAAVAATGAKQAPGIIETAITHRLDPDETWQGPAQQPELPSWRAAPYAVTIARDLTTPAGADHEMKEEPRVTIRGLQQSFKLPGMTPVSLPVDRFSSPHAENGNQPFSANTPERGAVTMRERPARRQAPSHITQLVRSRRRA